jgi:hypothetical protein
MTSKGEEANMLLAVLAACAVTGALAALSGMWVEAIADVVRGVGGLASYVVTLAVVGGAFACWIKTYTWTLDRLEARRRERR